MHFLPSRAKALEQLDHFIENNLVEYSKLRNFDFGPNKKNKVNGFVKLKLYKGNVTIMSRQTKSNAYSMKKVSFEENKTFNKSNVERFINFHKQKLRS